MDGASEAERLATRASAAESRANRLETNYRNLESELAAAQKRIEDSQMSATQARRELSREIERLAQTERILNWIKKQITAA